MTFEHELRDRLRHEAASVALPGRDPASAARRATTVRRRRQLGAAAMVAVSAAAILGVPMLLANEDTPTNATNAGTDSGLPATGPIDFDFTSSGQGLLLPTALFQESGGTVYALSTEPGRPPDDDWSNVPRAIYQLAEDGTWQPLLLGELKAADLAGADGLLYAVSTGPADGSDATAAYLSTSSDGGENWTSESVDPPAPPSDVVRWDTDTHVSVETSGDTTLALVSHAFFPKAEELFPEMQGPDASSYTYTLGADGITLTKMDMSFEEVRPSGETGEDPEAIAVNPAPLEDTPVRTIAWSDLGVDDWENTTERQLFRRTGDGWEPLSADFGSLQGAELSRTNGRFAISGWNGDGSMTAMLVSDDGSEWTPVETPSPGRIVGVADALVNVPSFDFGASGDTKPVIQYSTDGGATWTELDLTEAGLDPSWMVYSADGGPLGLALAVGPADDQGGGGPQQLLFSGDLQDWTTTDLAEKTGFADISSARLLVGEDRVVVNIETFRMSQSATLVGTPTR